MSDPQTPVPGSTSARIVEIDAEHAGQRVDNYLMACFRDIPKARIYRGLRSGEVRVNKGRIKQTYRLREGDALRLPPWRHQVQQTPSTPSLSLEKLLESAVIFEDDALMVINKPSGLAVHGGSGQSLGLIEALRSLHPHEKFLELVHRLDRGTSGCLILAKRRRALVALHEAFRSGHVDKRYRLVVQGEWRGGGRRIELPLQRNVLRSGERVVRVQAGGQESQTAFTPLKTSARASFMEARPLTGRTHQIRVHAASLDMPVAGDERYGNREFNQYLRSLGLKRLFLHASRLRFSHPLSAQAIEIKAPLPDELARVTKALGLVIDDPE